MAADPPCYDGAVCSNTGSGFYNCGSCPRGFTGDGVTCADVDEVSAEIGEVCVEVNGVSAEVSGGV